MSWMEITSSVKSLQREWYDKLSDILVGCGLLWLGFMICIHFWLSDCFMFYFMDAFLNWWFNGHSMYLNFSLSPRTLVHKLLTEIEDVSTSDIILKWMRNKVDKMDDRLLMLKMVTWIENLFSYSL